MPHAARSRWPRHRGWGRHCHWQPAARTQWAPAPSESRWHFKLNARGARRLPMIRDSRSLSRCDGAGHVRRVATTRPMHTAPHWHIYAALPSLNVRLPSYLYGYSTDQVPRATRRAQAVIRRPRGTELGENKRNPDGWRALACSDHAWCGRLAVDTLLRAETGAGGCPARSSTLFAR